MEISAEESLYWPVARDSLERRLRRLVPGELVSGLVFEDVLAALVQGSVLWLRLDLPIGSETAAQKAWGYSSQEDDIV